MSSEIDSLVEAITDLVLAEFAERPKQVESVAPKASPPGHTRPGGVPILVAPGPEIVEGEQWAPLMEAESLKPSVLVWNGCRQDQLPESVRSWSLEARTTGWSDVVQGYRGVVLLGSDLGVLSGVANLGAGGGPPSGVAIAAIASGVPVFMDDHSFEKVRRHSSRLASGFVRRFEEFFRLVAGFGVSMGGHSELERFLDGLNGSVGQVKTVASKSGGRDVITVEDLEVVRKAERSRLEVAMGTIVTPLARQRAAEWGIEVVFQ